MLVLSRKLGEEIVIGENFRLTVVEIAGRRVRLVLTAPRDVIILRGEVHSPVDPTPGSPRADALGRGVAGRPVPTASLSPLSAPTAAPPRPGAGPALPRPGQPG
jgi:carbon storage regulator CsrA